MIILIIIIIHYFNIYCNPLFYENLGSDEKLDNEIIIRYEKITPWISRCTEMTILKNGTLYYLQYQYYINPFNYTLMNGLLIENSTFKNLNTTLLNELFLYLNLTNREYNSSVNNMTEFNKMDYKKWIITNFSLSKLSSSKINELIDLFYKNNFFHLKDKYDGDALDVGVHCIYFSHNNKIKSIGEINGFAPYEYNIIQDKLEKIQSEKFGTKYYKENFGEKELFPVFNLEFFIICFLLIILIYLIISKKKLKK